MTGYAVKICLFIALHFAQDAPTLLIVYIVVHLPQREPNPIERVLQVAPVLICNMADASANKQLHSTFALRRHNTEFALRAPSPIATNGTDLIELRRDEIIRAPEASRGSPLGHFALLGEGFV